MDTRYFLGTLNEGEVKKHAEALREGARALALGSADGAYASPIAVLHTPFDEETQKVVKVLAEELGRVKAIFLVGIGGSDLGARAVYEACAGFLEKGLPAEMHFFETVDTIALARVSRTLATLEAKDVVLLVASKSGETSETLVNAEQVFASFVARFGEEEAKKRTVVLSDAESMLTKKAQAFGVCTRALPRVVGGRFSVFSVVGLLPLALAGVDVGRLCRGAQNTLIKNGFGRESLEEDMRDTQTERMRFDAGFLFSAYRAGYMLHELFLFHPALASLGLWYRQLFAESLGKESGEGERVGFVPMVALGSTDLHSVGQMIFGGAENRVSTLLAVPEIWEREVCVGKGAHTPFGLSALAGKKAGMLMRAIFEGVEATYRRHELPLRVCAFEAHEEGAGAFLAEQMVQVLLLGALFKVDVFNQPAVEEYKVETKRVLEEG